MTIYGSVVAFIAILGTFSVARESQKILLTHMVLMLILCAVELIIGTLFYLKITPITEKLKTDMYS